MNKRLFSNSVARALERMRLILVIVGAVALAFTGKASAGYNPGRIAFLMGPDVYSMKPDGSDIQQLTNLGSQNIIATYESWSFDGKQIVFVEIPPNGPPQLWLMKFDGTNQHQVFDDGQFQDWAPSFSPDGSLIIFTRCQPTWPAFTKSCAIYGVKPDGTGLTPITHYSPAVNEWEANYSPDGQFISFEAFGLDGYSAAVYLMNPDGTNIQRITKPDPCAIDANWSADSKKVVVWTVACTYGPNELWTMNADGTDIQHLTNTQLPIVNVNPSWSPDGNFVTFERDDLSKGTNAIVVISADGKDERQLVELRTQPKPPSALAYESTGRKASRHLPRQIEQGGGFPKWGAAQ